jgi:hypothetical protein
VENPTILTIQNNYISFACIILLYLTTIYCISDYPREYWELENYFSSLGMNAEEFKELNNFKYEYYKGNYYTYCKEYTKYTNFGIVFSEEFIIQWRAPTICMMLLFFSHRIVLNIFKKI